MIVIGTSLGGLHALEQVLRELPRELPTAVAIAQHRHKISDEELIAHLQRSTVLPMAEVEDKQQILVGHIYLAPADYHLLIEPGYFSLSTEAPVHHARPSIDVLFETAADTFGRGLIGVILTGASQDGAKGLAKISTFGGVAIIQDPRTAESAIMPNAAILAVPDAYVVPLSQIAHFLINQCSMFQGQTQSTSLSPC